MTTRDFSPFEDSPWFAGGPDKLGAARAVPTMLAHEEQMLLHWLTAAWAEGSGAVVDLGCFAGGATARLAEGQRSAGQTAPIHGYDRFAVDAKTRRRWLDPAGAPNGGGDLLPTAEALLAPWADRVTLHRGDLQQADWTGGPIEILVVDASKSTDTLDAIARVFYPALRPGSVVALCGALHWREPWVVAQMRLMADCFTPLAHAHDTTLVFGCTRTPDRFTLAQGRTADLGDAAFAALLASARPMLEDFGAGDRLDEMRDALVRSPGARKAWQIVPKG